MPFDTRTASLQTLVEIAGVMPIESTILTEHCAAEIKRHPPSWRYRNHDWLSGLSLRMFVASAVVSLVSAIVAIAILIFVGDGSIITALAVIAVVSPFVIVGSFALEMTPTRGPAYWTSKILTLSELQQEVIPLEIRSRAEKVSAEDTRVLFLYGTLYQERVLLDPFLKVVRDHESVCIGIWDGNTIIA